MVLKGSVETFKYADDNTHFGIFILNTADLPEGSIAVKGNVFGISEGDYIEVTGEMDEHPLYGEQIKMTSFRAIQPTDTDAVIKYLASGALRGVGSKLAARIFASFGEKTLHILENEPERLAEVKGISLRMAQSIAEEYAEKKSTRDAVMFLQKYNISNSLASKIFEKYKDQVYTVLTDNPYKLAEDIVGVGFKTVDEIAKNVGISFDSEQRIEAGIQYSLILALDDGHTCLPKDMLIERAMEVLGVEKEAIELGIGSLCVANKLKIKKPDRVFLTGVYIDEAYCAGKLATLKDAFHEVEETEEAKEALKESIDKIISSYSFELDSSQIEAIKKGIGNGIFLLTGGPGTGKTTIIKALIDYFYETGMDVILCAPTGRAAKRMSEATGFEAKTLHRLLEAQAVERDKDKTRFARNENNKLEADVYIVDEMSMVDLFLFTGFLKAVPVGSRVILVGDVNQLPSVGPGNIFKDLLESGYFASSVLEVIHRQCENSMIITNAHKVNKGECPSLDAKIENEDFFFLERKDRNILRRDIVELVKLRIPRKFEIDPLEIQVLSPSRKGDFGVEAINVFMQRELNPPDNSKPEIMKGDTIFRLGDKVMQIKNNYDIEWCVRGKNGIKVEDGYGIYNGDIGIIIGVNKFEKSMTVLFDDVKEVVYIGEELDELELAYATTIHKAQGSEYGAIVIPIFDTPRQLLSRNLLYTAITRATKCVMLMGSSDKVKEMISNDGERKRYTNLRERLTEVMDT